MNIELVPLISLPWEVQLKTRIWRNSQDVAQFFKIKHISEETHIKWLNSQQSVQPLHIAYVIAYEAQYVGLTYFHSIDREKRVADWGIYIHNEEARGRGIGKTCLRMIKKIAIQELGLQRLYLDVEKNNKPALKLYESCGFSFVADEEDDFLRYSCSLS